MALAGSIKGVVGRGFGFSSAIGLVITAGYGSSDVTIIAGPFLAPTGAVGVGGGRSGVVWPLGSGSGAVSDIGGRSGEVIT